MKSILSAAFAATLMASTAMAADPFAEKTPYDWSGIYVGVHGGYGWGQMSGLFDTGGAPGGIYTLSTVDLEGGVLGVHAGYNHQWGQFVVGIEGDVSGAWIEDTVVGAPLAGNVININPEIDLLASIRARGGVAMNNFLVYGTVGAGYVSYDFTSTFAPLIGVGTVSDDDWGVVFGGGVEYAWGNWLFRVEALHYDVDTTRLFVGGEIPDADGGDFINYSGVTVVRGGVSFKF